MQYVMLYGSEIWDLDTDNNNKLIPTEIDVLQVRNDVIQGKINV